MAHHALELHTVEAKGTIAVDHQNTLAGAGQLRGHSKARACSQAAHWARIKPVARSGHVNHLRGVAHDIPTITHNCRILVDEIADLTAEAHGMDRHSLRIQRSAIAFLAFALLLADIPQPFSGGQLPRARRELAHTQTDIANQRGLRSPIY